MNVLDIKINNLLRVIFGIYRQNGIPIMGTRDMYENFGMLRLGSLFKLRLFRLMHALLNGKLPELYDILLRPYINNHNYATRRGLFRHPDLTCEIERRFLSYQLIIFYENFPNDLFEYSLGTSLYKLKLLLASAQ